MATDCWSRITLWFDAWFQEGVKRDMRIHGGAVAAAEGDDDVILDEYTARVGQRVILNMPFSMKI